MGGYVNTLCLLSTPINPAVWKRDKKNVFRVNLKMHTYSSVGFLSEDGGCFEQFLEMEAKIYIWGEDLG